MVYRSGFSTRTKIEAFEGSIMPEPMSGCWLWTGAKFSERRGGYGSFTHRPSGTQNQRAHRAAWEIYVGTIPPDVDVLHRCDVPLCCNPSHLFLGDQASNMRDMATKGRQAEGPRHGMFKHGRYVGQKKSAAYA